MVSISLPGQSANARHRPEAQGATSRRRREFCQIIQRMLIPLECLEWYSMDDVLTDPVEDVSGCHRSLSKGIDARTFSEAYGQGPKLLKTLKRKDQRSRAQPVAQLGSRHDLSSMKTSSLARRPQVLLCLR